jgi:hypothetical protein
MTNTEIGRSLASSFVEMAAALDKLPQVEADLTDAKAEIDKLNARIAFLSSRNTELGDQVVKLEADLAHATKSEQGHKVNTELLLEQARHVMDRLGGVIELVDPKPVAAPPPEVVLPNPLHVGETSGQSGQMTGEATSPAADIPAWERPIVQVPFADPTSRSGPEPRYSDQSGGQSEASPTNASVADGTTSTAPDVGNTSVPSPTPSGDSQSDRPMSRPYWLKPSNMSWKDWQSNNGDVPYWVTAEMMDLV